jgi:hypothetical protein
MRMNGTNKLAHVQGDFAQSFPGFDLSFLLNVFSHALPKSLALFRMLQTKLFDIQYSLKKTCDFQCELKVCVITLAIFGLKLMGTSLKPL